LDALTLDEALRLAAERSQHLIAQAAAATSAREMAVAAGQPPDAVLTAGINNLPINGPDHFSLTRDFMTMRSIGLMRELTRHDKRDARAARFTREAEAAEAGGTLALANLQRETAVAWLDRHYQERMRGVLVAQRDEAALQIEAADLAYRSGLGSQSDVFAARSSVVTIEDRIAETDRKIEVATTHLGRWIGPAASRPLADLPATDVVSLHAADLDAQIAHHPQIALMVKQEEVARADAELARANKRSDWNVEVMYSQRGPDFSDMVSVNVSKPLQWRERNKQDRELTAQLAIAAQLRAEREEETRMHSAEARVLLQTWQSNRDRLRRYTDSLVPLAGERTRAATAAYRGGTGGLSDVLESRVGEIETRLDHLLLEMQTAQLWAELTYLLPAGHDTAAHE
jgi:outer membrane protein TolC